MTKLKYFLGACILAGGALIKLGAPLVPIALGLALAAVGSWKVSKRPRGIARRAS
jgi:hypothetical protein